MHTLRTALVLLLCLALAPSRAGAEPVAKPVAFYMKNLPCPRIGTWTDAQIRADLEQQGFIVIDLDCSSYPKTSPELEDALCEFNKSCRSIYSAYNNDNQTVDEKSILYVPEGYTVLRGIPVWNIVDHGAEGSVERVMDTWNKEIVEGFGVSPVTSADQMYNQDGTPIDWWLRMDVIYPSGTPSAKVPLLLNFSSNSPRFYPFSPVQTTDEVLWRNMFPFGFLTSGYAFANADHCYNPLARSETWKYFDRYSLEDWNGLATVTAYVRYLKSHLNELNLNGKIGVMGISKASYSAVRIADTQNATGSEHFLFNSTPNTKEQPWSGVDSKVDVAYAAAGNGTRRIPKYAKTTTVPMITSAGKKDQYGQWDAYPEVVSHLNSIDHNHLQLWMEELGHTYPGKGTDFATGERRYTLFKRFFDHYLKPDASTAADVFYILPKEGANTVNNLGESRFLPSDNYLPSALLGISKTAPLTVRFLEEFDLQEVSSKITVKDAESGTAVAGEWSASMHGTCFSFAPESPLTMNASYEITVPASLSSKEGNHPSSEMKRRFTVTQDASQSSSSSVPSQKILPTDDTYTATAKNTTPRGTMTTLRMRYSTMGDWRFNSYLKFNLAEVDTTRMTKAIMCLAMSAAIEDTIKINFYKTLTEWDEGTLVSANKPDLASAAFDAKPAMPETSWIEVDVTDVLKKAISAGEKTLGICGRVPDTEKTTNVYVHSKESESTELRPYLAIFKALHTGPATIDIAREYPAGTPIDLSLRASYESEITSIAWYVDGVLCETPSVTLESGIHKIKAVVEAGETTGREIIVKYVKVN